MKTVPWRYHQFCDKFQRAHDCNRLSEGVAVGLLTFFMAKSSVYFFIICMTLKKDVDAAAILSREIEGQECNYTYVEKVTFLLNS